MKIFTRVDRYIFKSFLLPFFTGVCFFTFILILDPLKRLLELAIEKNAPIIIIIKLFLNLIPPITSLSIPVGVLFGVLMSYGIFSANSEIIAMRSCGIRPLNIYRPAILFGIIMTIGVFFWLNNLVPYSNQNFSKIYRLLSFYNPGLLLESRVFKKVPNNPHQQISVWEIEEDTGVMGPVIIYDRSPTQNKLQVTFAKEGEWLNNNPNSELTTLHLKKGRRIDINLAKNRAAIKKNDNDIQESEFDKIDLNIEDKRTFHEINSKSLRERTVFEISDIIKEIKGKKRKVRPVYYIELNKKLSIPFACIIFVIIAIPMGTTFHRSGKGISFGAAIIISIVYYVFLQLGILVAEKGGSTAMAKMGIWIPNIITFIVAIFIALQKFPNIRNKMLFLIKIIWYGQSIRVKKT